MPTPNDHQENDSFDEVLLEYLRSLDSGEPVDREQFIQEHPRHVDQLRAYFDDSDAVSGMMDDPDPIAGSANEQADGEGVSPPQPRVLHICCPHCQNNIELVDEAECFEITCPVCDSCFTLREDGAVPAGATSQSNPCPTIARFELLEIVGEGAFGTVWKARDAQLERTVALKIPRPGQIDRRAKDLFLKEARAAAQLRHPKIVSVHEVGIENGTVYIVSDFIEGRPLNEWLVEQHPAHRESAQLCIEIAEALEYAHEEGIVHRDLKPGNIMIDASRHPHLMDFGLAKRNAGEISMTIEGRILGTPAYMSPEQAHGESHRADRRSDVYSLGVVFYELLTGERPFRGGVHNILAQVTEDEPQSPRKLNSNVSQDHETICLKCLEKSPGRRYQTAQEVAEELQRSLQGEPILARPIGSLQRVWRWCRRKPVVAGLVIGVFASLFVGTAVAGSLAVWALGEKERADTKTREARQQKRAATQETARANDAAVQAEIARSHAEDERERSERHLYHARIGLAYLKWLDGDIQRMEMLLDACPVRMRGWEWGYLRRHCHLGLRTFQTHSSIDCMAISADGRRIVSGHTDGTINAWDTVNGDLVLKLEGYQGIENGGAVNGVAFSADGRHLASASSQGGLMVWDAATGEKRFGFPELVGFRHAASRDRIAGFPVRTRVLDVAMAPDGRRLVSGGLDGAVRIWDARTGAEQLALEGHAASVRAVAVSSDSRWIASGSSDTTVKLWDAVAGVEDSTLRGHTDQVICLAFSPDGTRLASGGWDCSVRIWDPRKGEQVALLDGHKGAVGSLAFSPDGRHIASGSADSTVKIWDATSGKEVHTLKGHRSAVSSVAFVADGRRVVSAGADGTIKIWDALRDSTHQKLDQHTKAVFSVAFSSDGRWIASGGADSSVRIWDAATGTLMLTLDGHSKSVLSVSFSPDGRRVVSGGSAEAAKVWDIGTGKEVLSLANSYRPVFSQDDERIVCSSSLNRKEVIKILDVSTGAAVQTLAGRQLHTRCVSFSPDGQQVVSGHLGGFCKIWDLASGNELLTFGKHDDMVYQAVFSPDSKRIASAGRDFDVKVWDAKNGEQVLRLQGHTDSVGCVAFSPDGSRLASGSDDDRVIVWDAMTGAELLRLEGHADDVTSVAFSPDGRQIVSGSEDSTVRIWDVINSDSLPPIQSESPGRNHISALTSDSGTGASADRRAAEWVLGIGGGVHVSNNKHQHVVHEIAELPEGPLRVDVVVLAGSDRVSMGLLKSIGRLSGVHEINLDDTSVGDAALTHFDRLQQLRRLWLANGKVTDKGLAHLRNMNQLERINLAGTQVSDTGLQSLKEHKQLEWLDLSRTRITDAGLANLEDVSSLRELLLNDTSVTDDGVAKLQAKLSGCRIEHGPSNAENARRVGPDNRIRYRSRYSTFTYLGDKTWLEEMHRSNERFHHKETGRTNEYIEIHDARSKSARRIYSNFVMWGHPEKNRWYDFLAGEGHWNPEERLVLPAKYRGLPTLLNHERIE